MLFNRADVLVHHFQLYIQMVVQIRTVVINRRNTDEQHVSNHLLGHINLYIVNVVTHLVTPGTVCSMIAFAT